MAAARVGEAGIPIVYLNMVGGQDELVFDGGSFVVDAEARVVASIAPVALLAVATRLLRQGHRFLGGVTVLKGKALTHQGKAAFQKSNKDTDESGDTLAWQEGELYRPVKPSPADLPDSGTVDLELIPYYTWANRGLAYMDVWISLAQ